MTKLSRSDLHSQDSPRVKQRVLAQKMTEQGQNVLEPNLARNLVPDYISQKLIPQLGRLIDGSVLEFYGPFPMHSRLHDTGNFAIEHGGLRY